VLFGIDRTIGYKRRDRELARDRRSLLATRLRRSRGDAGCPTRRVMTAPRAPGRRAVVCIRGQIRRAAVVAPSSLPQPWLLTDSGWSGTIARGRTSVHTDEAASLTMKDDSHKN
jgi:hypothetical protein